MRDLLGSVKRFHERPPAVPAAAGGAPSPEPGLAMPFTTSEQQVTSGKRAQGYNGTLTTVLLARAASAAIIVLGVLSVMFGFVVAVFGVVITNPLGFFGVAVCFALLTASFGLLIAAYGKTTEAARGIAIFATLIMVMLGGAWVPSFMFPPWVQQVTVVMPTRWAVDGFDAMIWRGLGMDAAGAAMAAQLGFTLLFAVLAITKFRRDQLTFEASDR